MVKSPKPRPPAMSGCVKKGARPAKRVWSLKELAEGFGITYQGAAKINTLCQRYGTTIHQLPAWLITKEYGGS